MQGLTDLKSWSETNFVAWELENESGTLQITLKNPLPNFFIEIYYTLKSPVAGLRFFGNKGRNFVVTEAQHENKRLWMPCNDTLHSIYPLSIDFKVPHGYIVIASGELREKLEDPNWRWFKYVAENIYIDTFGFVVGQFDNILEDAHLSYVTHFSVDKDIKYTVAAKFTTAQIISFFAEQVGSAFPFTQFKQVFVPELGSSAQFSGLSILDEKWILNSKCFDGVLDTMWQIASGVAYNWSGAYYRPASWSDYWITISIQKYLANLFLGDRFDSQELKLKISNDVEKYCN